MKSGETDSDANRYVRSGDERHDLFANEVGETRELWVAKQGAGWFAMQSPEGANVLPVWPSRTDVEVCFPRELAGSDFEPVGVSLSDFVTKTVPVLRRQGCKLLVFPNSRGHANIVGLDDFVDYASKVLMGGYEVKVRVRKL